MKSQLLLLRLTRVERHFVAFNPRQRPIIGSPDHEHAPVRPRALRNEFAKLYGVSPNKETECSNGYKLAPRAVQKENGCSTCDRHHKKEHGGYPPSHSAQLTLGHTSLQYTHLPFELI